VTVEYHVQAVAWPDAETGATNLARLLNERAGEGWRFVSAVPTRAATSLHGIVTSSASADTNELAVILERDRLS
jgi:hypothetical protein